MMRRLLIGAQLLLWLAAPLAAQIATIVEKDVTVLGFKLHYRDHVRSRVILWTSLVFPQD
jgi:hypothetical protein